MMIGNKDSIDYLENKLPSMIGELKGEEENLFARFSNRVRYTLKLNEGVPPKLYRGKRVAYNYYKCGNCDAGLHDVCDKYCWNCGCAVKWRYNLKPEETPAETLEETDNG